MTDSLDSRAFGCAAPAGVDTPAAHADAAGIGAV
jgi:hypothetical protein